MNAREALGLLRLEDGRGWLDEAHPWQLEDAYAALDGERPYHWHGRARGFSKTTDNGGIAAAELASAAVPLRCYWLAADRDQAGLCLDVIRGFVSRSPALAARLRFGPWKVTGPAGATLEILPADAPGTWGLLPDRIYVDEIANWPDTPSARSLWHAMSTAAAKRSTCRMSVMTTAGVPSHWSFTDIYEPAQRSSLWRVAHREGPAPWMSRERLEEQRSRLPESVYLQLFENRWVEGEGSFLDEGAVARALVLDGPAGAAPTRHLYAAALDLGSVHDRSAFVIGHRVGPAVFVDWLQTWQGSKRRRWCSRRSRRRSRTRSPSTGSG